MSTVSVHVNNSSPTLIAWINALESFKKSLPAKDLKHLQSSTSPEDLISEVKEWNVQKRRGTTGVMDIIQNGVTRLNRFGNCIDQISQGFPDPACLLWGCIRFVLTMVQDAVEEYEKVSAALGALISVLSNVEIYIESLHEPKLVQEFVKDLFVATLHFWVKACKFYHRRRLWNSMPSSWSDYEVEFSRLEIAMMPTLERVEKGALLEHIGASKAFMVEKQLWKTEPSICKEYHTRDDTIALLAPSHGDLEYYSQDHRNIRRLRHPNTCRWLLEDHRFLKWAKTPVGQNALFWINSGPGAGKTVLCSSIIDHFQSSAADYGHPTLIYFYFKEGSTDNDNAKAAVQSLVYQISQKSKKARENIEKILRSKIDKVLGNDEHSFERCWFKLGRFLSGASNTVVVLDGLDECRDANDLLPKLVELGKDGKLKILLSSRREKYFLKHLGDIESLIITPADIQEDIHQYVEFKTTLNPRLSHPLVRDRIVEKLVSRPDGMFLWVHLMLKELKTCLSVENILETLNELPEGLEAVYTKIIQRLQKNLNQSAAEMTRAILSWVLGSARPLSMDELREALLHHYQLKGHMLLSDGEFPYAEKDIELICGSVIMIGDGVVQLVHQTARNYLIQIATKEVMILDRPILPEFTEMSLQLASVCLNYIGSRITSSLADIQEDPLNAQYEPKEIQNLQKTNKFLEYACFFWMNHVLDCPQNNIDEATSLVKNIFSNSATLSWVETSLLLNRPGLWRLVIGVEDIQDWARDNLAEGVYLDTRAWFLDWCSGLLKFFESYSTVLLESPWFIRRLDISSFLPPTKDPVQEISNTTRELEYVFHTSLTSATADHKIPAKSRLGHYQTSLLKAELGFFVYDKTRDIFLSGERWSRGDLFIQHAETGKRLSPARESINTVLAGQQVQFRQTITAKVSSDGTFLAIAYDKCLSVWIIKRNIGFSHRINRRDWANLLLIDGYHERMKTMSTQVIEFKENNRLLVPGGWYSLPSKIFHPFQPSPILDPFQSDLLNSTFFSGDGSFIFREYHVESTKTVIRRPTHHQERSLSSLDIVLSLNFNDHYTIMASETGNYLVLWARNRLNIDAECILFNITSRETYNISQGLRNFGSRSFQFSPDDKELITFLGEPRGRNTRHGMLTVSVWKMSAEEPVLCCSGRIRVVIASNVSTVDNYPLFTIKTKSLALIVTCDRLIQEVQFDTTKINFPGYVHPKQARERFHSQLSQDASRFANVHVDDDEAHIQILNLHPTGNDDIFYETKFRLSTKYGSPSTHPICLSPNFDTLVIGSLVYTIDISSVLECLKLDFDIPDVVKDFPWNCSASSCGNFIAFDKPSYQHNLGVYDTKPAHCIITEIDRLSHEFRRLDIIFPLPLQQALPVFHPWLPLAALACLSETGRNNNMGRESELRVSASSLQLSYIQLDGHRVKDITQLPYSQPVKPRLQFSDCGSFMYIFGWDSTKYLPYRIIVSPTPKNPHPRKIQVLEGEQYTHPSFDRCYKLSTSPTDVRITMYQFQSDLEDSFPRFQTAKAISHVSAITFYPSIKWGRSDVWLLLGSTYSETMHCLLRPKDGRPPFIKKLVFSWDQVRDRLETTLKPIEVEEKKNTESIS